MMVPLLRREGADCIVGGHAFLSRIADSSCTWNEAEVPGGNFFGSTLPGALKAKGGMSDDSVGVSRIAHVHSRIVEPDRGCSPLDR